MADKDFETKIKITGDSKEAENAVSSVSKSLRSLLAPLTAIRSAMSMVMRAMGVFYLAAEGVRMVVGLYQKLHDWVDRAAKAARELADRMEQSRNALAAQWAVEHYKQLNKELAEANRLERERNAILDQRKATTRDLEDASAERNKQLEIAKLDPASATYGEERAAIERKYAREASSQAAARATEDAKAKAQSLYAEANIKDRQANQYQRSYNELMRVNDRQTERVFRLGQEARKGVAGAQEQHDAAEREANATFDQAMAAKDAMEALRKEAESLRRQAGELTGGGRAANIRNEAVQLRIDNEERDAAARKEKAAREEAERMAEQQRREQERKDAEKRREAERAAGEIERKIAGYERGVASVAPSGNRLTAMGLGAGAGVARVQEQMANSLKDLVKASKEQLAELKAIANSDNTAVFAD